jgi:hypothetical protein
MQFFRFVGCSHCKPEEMFRWSDQNAEIFDLKSMVTSWMSFSSALIGLLEGERQRWTVEE